MDGSRNNSVRLALQKHSEEFRRKEFRLSALFGADTARFQEYSLDHEGLLLDYSKNLINYFKSSSIEMKLNYLNIEDMPFESAIGVENNSFAIKSAAKKESD